MSSEKLSVHNSIRQENAKAMAYYKADHKSKKTDVQMNKWTHYTTTTNAQYVVGKYVKSKLEDKYCYMY